MARSIIRSRTLITRTTSRTTYEQIEEGALLQDGGVIVRIGTYQQLKAAYPDVPVLGSGDDIMLPGFVNAHHHIGLTPVQLGSPDMPLELWFVTRLVMRSVDLYLDTLYSAFEMIASGVTTVQHIQSLLPGNGVEVESKVDRILKAYDDIGMRVSYCYGVRDQNRLVYQADEVFLATLPPTVQGPLARHFARFKMDFDDLMGLFRDLHARHHGKRRVRIQLAPGNLHWCSDQALAHLADTSASYNVPLHMHLVETALQKEYAAQRGGCTSVEYLDRFGLVTPRLTIGHGVWLTERDLDRIADAGTCICHNCSSNFRLRSGIAPLNAFEARGITTAIGMDEAGLNDDRDMLQEMRLVLRAHRVPGLDEADIPTIPQVLRMATAGGARTTPYFAEIGTLEVGKAADLVLIDWPSIAYPFLDPATPVLDALIQRATTKGVRMTMCDGEVIYADGQFTKVDREAALKSLHDDLQRALADDEVERRGLAKALLPYVKAFYRNDTGSAQEAPFYRMNSRI